MQTNKKLCQNPTKKNKFITYLFLSIDKMNQNKKKYKNKSALLEQERNGNPKYKRIVTNECMRKRERASEKMQRN